MVLSTVTDRLGGRQAKRVLELVDDLWDSRKKIVEMVDFVWDQRDAITGVIEFVGDNQERIADLVSRLPDLVGTAGVGLEAAGSGAQRASLLLASDDENGPRHLSATAADALERCQEQLADIAGLLSELGEGLDKVRIPTIQAERSEVMGFSLISGVDIGERPLLDTATKRIGDGAVGLTDVAERLGDVAGRFRALGEQLVDVGGDLGTAGDELTGSGGTLRSFVGDMPAAAAEEGRRLPATSSAAPRGASPKQRRTTSGPTKTAAATKHSAKKTTAKKKTAKKKATAKRGGLAQAASASKTTAKKRAAKKKSATKK